MTETVDITPGADALVERLLKAACDRELKLVTAESCTGGLIASLLTDVSGCGHAFERGFVVYTNESKHELLGVPIDLLDDPGPVSEAVARAMAAGALARSNGDLALAVTGFAGPGPGAIPGLVHFATARKGSEVRHEERLFREGDRAGVRRRAVEMGLRMMSERIF